MALEEVLKAWLGLFSDIMWIFPSSFLYFLTLWMGKFPNSVPFSNKGTSIIPCLGSRNRLLLSTLRSPVKSQLLHSKLHMDFSFCSGPWRVTELDLQICPIVRHPQNAMEGFFRDPRAILFFFFFNLPVEILEDCALLYQSFFFFFL